MKQHDVQSFMRSLPILASTLGRKLGVKIQIGGSACTDGETIYLPPLPLDGGEELFILANGYLDHEAAHVRVTDFDILAKQALSPLAFHLTNLVEDVRVERELAKIYPGCREHFKKLYGVLVKRVTPEDASHIAHNILAWLMNAVLQKQYQDVEFPVDLLRESVDSLFPMLIGELERFVQPGLACDSTIDCVEWAKSVEEFLLQYFSKSKSRPVKQAQEASEGETGPGNGEDTTQQSGEDFDHSGRPDQTDLPAAPDATQPDGSKLTVSESVRPSFTSMREHPGQEGSSDGTEQDQDEPQPNKETDNAGQYNGTASHGGSPSSASGRGTNTGSGSDPNISDSRAANASGNADSDEGVEPGGVAGLSGYQPVRSDGDDSLPSPEGYVPGFSCESSGIDMLDRLIQNEGLQELSEKVRESLGAMVNSESEMPRLVGEILKQTLMQISDENWGSDCLHVPTVKEAHLNEMPKSLIEQAQSATKVLATRLSGLLQTQTLSRPHTGRRGSVDGNRLHRLAVSNPRVFKKAVEEHRIDTAVHILLDCSSSMEACMSLANAACYSVASSLQRIRDVNIGVTAFPGEWDENNLFSVSPILKHGQRMHKRFAAKAYGGTPMGEALWWTCQQMITLKENRKIILILTDGYPDSFRSTEAALETARDMGFEIIGIGIGEYGAFICNLIENSRVINDIQELAPAMFSVLQQALTERSR